MGNKKVFNKTRESCQFRLDAELKKKLVAAAKAEGRSLNGYLTKLVAETLECED